MVTQLAALLWDGEVVECVQLHERNLAAAKPLRIDIDYIDPVDPAEISVRLGFASQQHFNTLFRTHAGCSPMKYRQARRQEKYV